LRLKNIRLVRFVPAAGVVAARLVPADVARGAMYRDRHLDGSPSGGPGPEGDAATGVSLEYDFKRDARFESRFVRVPFEVGARCGELRLELEGDGSGNKFFVVLHDRSGEQHVVVDVPVMWRGWQEFGVELGAFLDAPANMERLVTRWGGDGNQQLDFPVTAIDIGMAKRGARSGDRGRVRFRRLRFIE
jgi:hypothetical protein